MMSSPETKKRKETASSDMSTEGGEKDDNNATASFAKKLKNDDVPEDTWTYYENSYRLSKTGTGMTFQERVERLESQMEYMNTERRRAERKAKTLTKQLQEQKEAMSKYKKFVDDIMNEVSEEKVKEHMNALRQFTENRCELLFQKTLDLEEKQRKCNFHLNIIKEKEIGRTTALDKLIEEGSSSKNSR